MPKKKKKEFISNQGQRGPELELGYDSLNEKEGKVLVALNGEGKGTRQAFSIWDIVDALKWRNVAGGKWRGNSWVRNSLRRLIRARLVEHVGEIGEGMYQVSKAGRRDVNRALGLHQTKRKPKAPAKVAAKGKSAAKKATPATKRTKKAAPKKAKPAAEKPAEESQQEAEQDAPVEPLFPEQQAASA